MAEPKKKQVNYNVTTFIEVDGEQIRPREAFWVIYDPQKRPRRFFPSDATMKGNIARACRTAWYGDTNAILALNEGWHIELMGQKRFLAEVAPHIVPLED